MNLVYRKIHALILMAVIVVAVASFASTNAFAQVVTLLYEDRSADSQVGTEFEAGNGPFEIRWSASGGQFLAKLADGNDLELISSEPQSREEDAAGLDDRQNAVRGAGYLQDSCRGQRPSACAGRADRSVNRST